MRNGREDESVVENFVENTVLEFKSICLVLMKGNR